LAAAAGLPAAGLLAGHLLVMEAVVAVQVLQLELLSSGKEAVAVRVTQETAVTAVCFLFWLPRQALVAAVEAD
jgi:hypothetical protein